MRSLLLHSGWQLKERHAARPLPTDFASSEDWIAATVPGTVHQDLIAAGRIPDPFFGRNEREVQWVGERDWLYRCSFECPFAGLPRVDLCLDGLDTIATLWVNGHPVLSSDNMFVPHRVPVASSLREGPNELWLLFESALRHGRTREARHGRSHVWNGDPSRVYIRKAQYHYGWDWGPTLLTAGPWRAIRLEGYEARVADLHAPVEVSSDLRRAVLTASATIDGTITRDLRVRFSLFDPAGEILERVEVPVEETAAQHTFEVDHPELWWPRGHGEPALHRLEATLIGGEREHHRVARRLGMRRVRLRQEPLHSEPGTTFLFEINGVPLFCGGANWIPADSFTPRLSETDYRALLLQGAEANMRMLRVWGGGIYEEDIFYDTCDELGLLVWQDFMFACGLYPAHEAFLASVRAEAEAAVRRLGHHPSLVLWCGNNEDHMLAHSLGRYDPQVAASAARDGFPGRLLYERLLPEICNRLVPHTPYWPGSPFGGADPNDGTTGDRHVWDVWHGQMAPYGHYPQLGGRFVSEFGMQALPALATIDSIAPPPERHVVSRTVEHHNKAEGGPRRLAAYLSDTVRPSSDFAATIYATQLVQAEALGAALRGWRRQFGGTGRQAVAGALIWQFNDCWPATSWSIVDYAHRPKAAFYVTRRELAALAIGLAREGETVALWAGNDTQRPIEGVAIAQSWSLDGEPGATTRHTVRLAPNQSTELGTVPLEHEGEWVLGARLEMEGRIVARATFWPEPLKHLDLPDPGLQIQRSGDRLHLSVVRPAKGVWLSAGDGVRWSDNFLDLLPGDPQTVDATGIGDRRLDVRWLRWEE